MKKIKKLLAEHSFEVWKREIDFLFAVAIPYNKDPNLYGSMIIPKYVVDMFKSQRSSRYKTLSDDKFKIPHKKDAEEIIEILKEYGFIVDE